MSSFPPTQRRHPPVPLLQLHPAPIPLVPPLGLHPLVLDPRLPPRGASPVSGDGAHSERASATSDGGERVGSTFRRAENLAQWSACVPSPSLSLLAAELTRRSSLAAVHSSTATRTRSRRRSTRAPSQRASPTSTGAACSQRRSPPGAPSLRGRRGRCGLRGAAQEQENKARLVQERAGSRAVGRRARDMTPPALMREHCMARKERSNNEASKRSGTVLVPPLLRPALFARWSPALHVFRGSHCHTANFASA